MPRWLEISTDKEGLVIEMKRSGWVFEPNRPVGRPKLRETNSKEEHNGVLTLEKLNTMLPNLCITRLRAVI